MQYKITHVFTVTIDGIPAYEVFTSLKGACTEAGIGYQHAARLMIKGNISIIRKGRQILIVRALVVKQKKGRKDFSSKGKSANNEY